MAICFSCFHEYDDEYEICPRCGTIRDDKPVEPVHLVPGTILAGRYLVGKAVGSGGFGIIYKAWDRKLETIVAVKEFFANRLMTRGAGETRVIVNKKARQEYQYRKARFLAEARTMARFGSHRTIPNVFEFFEDNDTAYIIMELLTGQALNEYMKEHGEKIDRDFALQIVNEVGQALISMHKSGIIHRDVAPDNIFICTGSEIRIKLLDLGAAKLADSTDDVIDIILKPGYSPVEQYDNTASIGPWTDVYALGATLYVMLTGVKPDESTNRKIKDNVLPPCEIDSTIPENLSNAVMKAMAVERHLRFKNIEAFLEAINGERKVVSLKKEKKRRAGSRVFGIVAAVAAVVVVIYLVSGVYKEKKSIQVLPDSSITVWFSVREGSTENAAMQSVTEDFASAFPNVQIICEAIPEEEYQARLDVAAKSGKLPTLYESTGTASHILELSADISEVLQSEQAKDCLFLDQYDNYYEDHKQVPLAFSVPMAYIITSGNVSLEYNNTVFTKLADLGDDFTFAVDDIYKNLIRKNITEEPTADKEDFMDNESNTCAVLLSSSKAFNEVRETLTGYDKEYVYYAADTVFCDFDYEWSIGEATPSEKKTAVRLLSWMMGNNYQNMLMISRCQDGQIPLNRECFTTKTEQANYAALTDIYEHFRFD